MRNISDQNLIKISFFFSLLAHCFFLSMPGFNWSIPQPQQPENITVEIKIEKPPLLPKIDIMGEEKKLKEVVKEEKLPEPEPAPEPEPQPEEEKNVEEPQPKEQIEDITVEQPRIEPPQEIVEVINPQKEAMLRYQDIIKQKIESCRGYPSWAKKQGFEGSVYLKFTILSNGQAQDIKIIRSSGFNILDKEAVSTIKRVQLFPPIPEEMKVSSLTMEVSIVFTLR